MAVLQRRGVQSQVELQSLLQPDPAPEAKAHFPDLECAVQRLLLAAEKVRPERCAAITTLMA